MQKPIKCELCGLETANLSHDIQKKDSEYISEWICIDCFTKGEN